MVEMDLMIDPARFNPYLDYKLDPGEPGLENATPASLSVARVAGHELGNLIQFKSEAARRGGYVIYSNISISFARRGGFLAAIGGKTEAVIIYPGRRKLAGTGNTGIDIGDPTTDSLFKAERLREIEDRIREIENRIRTAKSEIEIEELEREKKVLELAKFALMSGMNPEFFSGLMLEALV